MIRIFFYRDRVDISLHIYSNIKSNTFVLVPPQFTLQSERDALFYLGKKALLDIEVISFSSVARKIAGKVGKPLEIINTQGRQMLMAKVLRNLDDRLQLFKGYYNKGDFIVDLLNLVADVKENGGSAEIIRQACEKVDSDLFSTKLEELALIIDAYESEICGRYMDNEDYYSYISDKLGESKVFDKKNVVAYGFDTLSQKDIELFRQMAVNSENMDIYLSGMPPEDSDNEESIFKLGKHIAEKLEEVCADEAIPFEISYIQDDVKNQIPDSSAIKSLERDLFKDVLPVHKESDSSGLRIVAAPTIYDEAVEAALFVQNLIREKGYHYGDIALIAGDLEARSSIFKRVFKQFGMDIFVDEKRKINHNCLVTFVITLLEMIAEGISLDKIITIGQTGLTEFSFEEIEHFETYCKYYGIRNNDLHKKFIKGRDKKDLQLEIAESVRDGLVSPVDILRKSIGGEDNNRRKFTSQEFVQSLLSYLNEEVSIKDKIQESLNQQEDMGYIEGVLETVQIYDAIVEIINQLVNIFGDEKLYRKELCQSLITGISLKDIGIVPPTADGLTMGNLQRSRRGKVKATLIVGMNEGVIPSDGSSNVLMNSREREHLHELGYYICRPATLQNKEEMLALYRSIATTSHELYISYNVSDNEGKEQKESYIINDIKTLLPKVQIVKAKGMGSGRNIIKNAGDNNATANLLIGQMILASETAEPLADEWVAVYRMLLEKSSSGGLWNSIDFSNKLKNIDPAKILNLYLKDGDDFLSLSPSGLEQFGRCPFAHFIKYGLRGIEIKEYIVSAIDAGTIYHSAFKAVTDFLNKLDDGWNKASKNQVEEIVDESISKEMQNYRDGLLEKDGESIHRTEAIRRLAKSSAWEMVNQVKAGNIKKIYAEIAFGRGEKLDALRLSGTDPNVIIEGQIDRVDYTAGGFTKVVDYKSGKDEFKKNTVLGGLKLQLILYLLAASKGLGESAEARPGGAFYFRIEEKSTDGSEELADATTEKIKPKATKLDGFLIDDPNFLDSLGREPKEIVITGSERFMEEKAFDDFMAEATNCIKKQISDIVEGHIDIYPASNNKVTPCTYCSYKSICAFDRDIEGCRYRRI